MNVFILLENRVPGLLNAHCPLPPGAVDAPALPYLQRSLPISIYLQGYGFLRSPMLGGLSPALLLQFPLFLRYVLSSYVDEPLGDKISVRKDLHFTLTLELV